MREFHKAVGQFVDYDTALGMFEPERVLFLAIPENVYLTFFQKTVIQKSIQRIRAKILVYNSQHEIIVTWIK